MGNMIKIMKGLLVLFLASLVIAVGGPAAAQTWTELAPSGGPPPGRIWPTVVHNQDNNRMVVFGGSNATQIFFVPPSVALLNDTWVLSNADGTESSPPAWTQLTANGAAGSPSKRAGHSAIFDKASNRMIVFGGNPTSGFATPRRTTSGCLQTPTERGERPPGRSSALPAGRRVRDGSSSPATIQRTTG